MVECIKNYVKSAGNEDYRGARCYCICGLNYSMEKFETAIETNGTINIDFHIDWICVSPKHGSELVVTEGNELKVVFPQDGQEIENFSDLSFDYLFLQPMDGDNIQENTQKTIQYCLKNPKWRLSIQKHKLIGMP